MDLMNTSDGSCWPLAHLKRDTRPVSPVKITSPNTPSPPEVEEYAASENENKEDEGKAPSPFLALPLEIRLEIFKYLLVLPSNAPSPSQKTYYQYGQRRTPSPLHPAILRANRQLHAEALPLLYRRNTFLAHDTLLTSLPRLRRAYDPVLSARLSGLITRFHVCVRLDAEPVYDRAQAAMQLSNKEEIVIDAWQAVWRGSGPDALRLFEDVRGVRRARVIGSVGGFEGYASWLERAMMREPGIEIEPFSWDADRGSGGTSI
ncbi:hypothetical protein GL218_02068 [Daldinia childiae]|uniref:uncharacterized protein n=1 Tax=Daldinia childiae TaxID=326645 RepID=UPI0014461408|nr:uncharacterized protein GL218_02068 [Daldinia childiae]KAF3065208.1 hypothetical protein GL218_02068 [Daldinia childiae]